MAEDNNTSSPRRCHVKVDVLAGAVGPIFSNLIKEVEAPKMEPTENDTLRISFVCMMEQLPVIIEYIVGDAIKLFIGPYDPEVKHQYEYRQRGSNYTPPQGVSITKLPPQRQKRNQYDGKKALVGESLAGRAMLKAFESRRVCNKPDLQEALVNAGYAPTSSGKMCSDMCAEGTLVRVGWGLYSLPARTDRLNVDQPTTEKPSED